MYCNCKLLFRRNGSVCKTRVCYYKGNGSVCKTRVGHRQRADLYTRIELAIAKGTPLCKRLELVFKKRVCPPDLTWSFQKERFRIKDLSHSKTRNGSVLDT